MPAYEYVCKDCNHEVTVFLSIKEFEAKPKIKCPHCQSDNVQKKISEFTAKTSKKSQLCETFIDALTDNGNKKHYFGWDYWIYCL